MFASIGKWLKGDEQEKGAGDKTKVADAKKETAEEPSKNPDDLKRSAEQANIQRHEGVEGGEDKKTGETVSHTAPQVAGTGQTP